MKRISDKIHMALKAQLKNELDSSRLYLAMSQWLEFNGWFGAAKLWKKYADEELVHVDRFYKYMQDRNAMPCTPVAKEQPTEFKGIKEIVIASYEHEVQVSNWIRDIALAALNEKDLHTYDFMMELIREQTEEEAKTLYWVDRVEMLEQQNVSLFFLDKEFSKGA